MRGRFGEHGLILPRRNEGGPHPQFFLVFRSLGISATSVTITMKPGSADPHADVRFSSSGAVNRSNDAPLADRLNLVIDGALARNRIVGTTILVARDGDIVFARAAGFADRENGQPVHADTIFRLASMTKPIVSAATLVLVEQGKIHLDDPVTRWLPDFRPALPNGHRPTITVRHLLADTA